MVEAGVLHKTKRNKDITRSARPGAQHKWMLEAREGHMNERHGRNGGGNAALHDAFYQQVSSSGDEAELSRVWRLYVAQRTRGGLSGYSSSAGSPPSLTRSLRGRTRSDPDTTVLIPPIAFLNHSTGRGD